MNEPDFSGINPLRVPTARRRLAAIREYLALPDRTADDTIRIGQSIGLSRWAFQRLVKVWTQYKRVELLVENKADPTHKKRTIPDRVIEMLRDEIFKAGPDASLKKLKPIIAARCADEGYQAPSSATIDRHLQLARTERPEMMGGEPRIIIGRVSFHLPVKEDRTDAIAHPLPQVILAVALPECIVLQYQVSVNLDEPPSVEKLVQDLLSGQTTEAKARPLMMDPIDRRLTRDLFKRFGIKKIDPNKSAVQKEMARAFGAKFGNLIPIYHPNHAKPGRRLVLTRQDEPLTKDEAIAAIENAIAKNNDSRLATKPEYTIKAARRV